MVENLYGKYDKATLVDNNLFDCFQFPSLKREVYTEDVPKGDGTITTNVKKYFRGLQRSTLINLKSLLMFSTQFVVMQCKNLLASRMHGGLLWLEKEYPIHIDDIHRLT